MYKPIAGLNGYEISDSGQIRSLKKKDSPRLMKLKITRSGCQHLNLAHLGYIKRVDVIVLESFIGPCPKGYYPYHKDGNQGNCSLENLEWSTINQSGRCGENSPSSTLSKHDVIKIRDASGTLRAIAKEHNTSYQTVFNIKHRKTWSTFA
jgi:hypothetical protein